MSKHDSLGWTILKCVGIGLFSGGLALFEDRMSRRIKANLDLMEFDPDDLKELQARLEELESEDSE